MLIMVLGLTVLAANRTGLSFNNIFAADNVPVMTSQDVVPGVQSDDGSVCMVYLEITDTGSRVWAGAALRGRILFNSFLI